MFSDCTYKVEKMSLELLPNELSQTEALWKSWVSKPDSELEATFKSLHLTNWMNVIQHLRSLGLHEDPQPLRLNVMVGNGLRFTLVGEGIIQEFCKDNTLSGKPFHVVLKEKRNQDTRTEVEWKEYGVRIKMRREIQLAVDDARVKDAISRWTTSPKSFRLIKRYSFSSLAHKGVVFDLSVVRHNRKAANGSYIPAVSFSGAEITRQPMTYEVEVEANHGSANLKSMYVGIATVLRGIQRSFVLVRESVMQDVVKLVSVQTNTPLDQFPGPKPVTLEQDNVFPGEQTVPNIRTGNYNVTDKADGLRCLLVVHPNGRIYLVDMNMTVYGTDCRLPAPVVKEWKGAILDGEWVRTDAKDKSISKYYAFDIFNGREGANVTQRPFMVSGVDIAVSRIAIMAELCGVLANVERIAPSIPTHQSFFVQMKTFRTGSASDPNGIFKEASIILDTLKENPPYHTDGLIFTPNASHLPMKQGTWEAQFKWKPAEDNTVDFLVMLEKERDEAGKPTRTELISHGSMDGSSRSVPYKSLRLYVGSTTDVAFMDPRETILYKKPIPESLDRTAYKPVEFKPQPPDAMASVCHVALEESAAFGESVIRCTRSGDSITDRCIVEMAYHPDRAAGWRWEPIRVRWDKTEQFQNGVIGGTLNSSKVADSVWSSIHNPVTEHMIRTGDVDEGMEESRDRVIKKSYYNRKAPSRDQFLVRGLRYFHNRYVKDDLLLSRVLRPDASVYDMTCGEAGDIHKWNHSKVRWVLGTDIAETNLTNNMSGAYRRYLDQIVLNKKDYTPMLFVNADASKRLADGGAGQTAMDRSILRTLWGSSSETVPPYVDMFKGKAKEGFDVVSCMFSIHYFFKDRSTLTGWLQNVADTLRTGGYFVGCCFDGDSVMDLLRGLPVNGTKKGVDGDVDVWTITKRYEESELPPNSEGLGKAIDVNFISIGETYTEYLVSWSYLKECMAQIGCELLNAEELEQIGLRSSSNLFKDSYEMAVKSGRHFPMTPVLQQFSFLNRWFIFKRREGGQTVAVPLVQEVQEVPEGTNVLPVTAPLEEIEEELETARPVLEEEEKMPNLAEVDMEAIPEAPEIRPAPAMNLLEEIKATATATDKPTAKPAAKPEAETKIVTLEGVKAMKAMKSMKAPEANVAAEKTNAVKATKATKANVAKPVAKPVAEAKPVTEVAALAKAKGPIRVFSHKAPIKDDLGIGDKRWAHWLLPDILTPITDLTDPSIVYPSMEAALASVKFQLASNKPKLGPAMFDENGDIHQKFARMRAEKGKLTEKDDFNLMDEEGDEVRKATKTTNMKAVGAKFNEGDWHTVLPDIALEFIKQRYETDERYRKIMDALKEARSHIVYYTTPKGNEFSGRVTKVENENGEEEEEIEGENLLGRQMMRFLGFYY